jgi:hypothetical protein
MKTRWTVVAAAVVVAGALATAPHARGDAFGFKGKSEVTKLELAYVPGTKTLKARFRTGLSAGDVELQTSDAENIDRLIQLADMKSRGSRLAVELEGSEIKAVYVAVGGSFLGKDE